MRGGRGMRGVGGNERGGRGMRGVGGNERRCVEKEMEDKGRSVRSTELNYALQQCTSCFP